MRSENCIPHKARIELLPFSLLHIMAAILNLKMADIIHVYTGGVENPIYPNQVEKHVILFISCSSMYMYVHITTHVRACMHYIRPKTKNCYVALSDRP